MFMKKLNFWGWAYVAICLHLTFSITLFAGDHHPRPFGIRLTENPDDGVRPLARLVEQARAQYGETAAFAPFAVAASRENAVAGALSKASVLQISTGKLRELWHAQAPFIELSIPMGAEQPVALELVRVKNMADDFRVFTSDSEDQPVSVTNGIHYRGIRKGSPGSVVAFSVFEGEIIGMISEHGSNKVLAQLEEQPGHYVFYDDKDLLADAPFTCGTAEEPPVKREFSEGEVNSRSSRCVNVYIECDYALYQNKGSVQNTVNWITAVFNNVATLYQNESISTAISEVFVWTSMDSYSRTSSSTALNQFRSARQGFNGDLAHLAALGGNNIGGVAWLDVLCVPSYAFAYSNVQSTYQNVPTYSWTVMVFTHEMGHNLGSNHTHWCGWSGGALDNCYTPEGSCARGPAPTNGGTVMSYCHLTSYGINLNNGFGTQPGNKIRQRYNAVSCLGACDGGGGNQDPCATPTGFAVTNITSSSATCSWTAVSGASSYNFQYKLSSSGTWNQASVGSTSVNLTNLTPNTSYDVRVQAVCSSGTSSFTNTVTFTSLQGSNGSYCTSRGLNATYEWIDLVRLQSINRTSGNDGGYYNGTSITTTLQRGSSYTIQYSAGMAGGTYTEYWRAWIDYNGNGVFDDPSERILSRTSASTGTLSSTFTVPANAVLGQKRIRIAMKYGAYPTPCESFDYGEVEDYTVNITATGGLPEGNDPVAGTDLQTLEVLQAYPNPVKEDLLVEFNADFEGDMQIRVVNLLGQPLSETNYHVKYGHNQAAVPVRDLRPGNYLLMLQNDNHREIIKFTRID